MILTILNHRFCFFIRLLDAIIKQRKVLVKYQKLLKIQKIIWRNGFLPKMDIESCYIETYKRYIRGIEQETATINPINLVCTMVIPSAMRYGKLTKRAGNHKL